MRVHIVQKGDTLWKIAKQYAIGFEELKRLNAHLANPDYIVPGMEIYLPDGSPKKEKEVRQQPMVKEQPQPQTVKEQPIQTPTPAPVPVPVPVQPQRPMWQGDVYFQPAPQPQPMPLPNWQQTHVHFQPTFEQTMTMPAQQPVMMPQQPIIIQQPAPVPAPQPQQPIFMEHPAMMPQYVPQMHPQMMPQMHPMPVCHHCQSMMATEHLQMHPQMMPQMMPQMQPMPVCQHCQGMMMEEHPQMQPIRQEESPTNQCDCPDREHQIRHYYENIGQMMCMPNPCYSPQMLPYQMPNQMPMQMMPQMNIMPQHPKSCH